MTRRGRPPVLDEMKRREIAALLTVGCSQRLAARYVGCAPATIRNTAARDPAFADKLRQVQCTAEVGLLRNIRDAAKKEQNWRAAAWMLERGYPQRYARRGPDTLTPQQIASLVTHLCQIVSEEVPAARYRQRVLKRLEELARGLVGPTQFAAPEPPQAETPDD